MKRVSLRPASHRASGTAQLYQHYGYGPFGLESIEGDATDYSHRFAGGMELGGIVLLGARPYDQEAGRSLAPDPIPQIINQYAYAMGNPVDFWDPGGLQPVRFTQARLVDHAVGNGPTASLYANARNEIAENLGNDLQGVAVSGFLVASSPGFILGAIAVDIVVLANETITGRYAAIPIGIGLMNQRYGLLPIPSIRYTTTRTGVWAGGYRPKIHRLFQVSSNRWEGACREPKVQSLHAHLFAVVAGNTGTHFVPGRHGRDRVPALAAGFW